MTPLDHRVMKAGYCALVEQADRHLGRILDALDTLVIFTADHGEMLGDFGRYGKSVTFEASAHIPFYICHPHVHPGDSRISTISACCARIAGNSSVAMAVVVVV
jgi:arylsulfatase A-like enzyme